MPSMADRLGVQSRGPSRGRSTTLFAYAKPCCKATEYGLSSQPTSAHRCDFELLWMAGMSITMTPVQKLHFHSVKETLVTRTWQTGSMEPTATNGLDHDAFKFQPCYYGAEAKKKTVRNTDEPRIPSRSKPPSPLRILLRWQPSIGSVRSRIPKVLSAFPPRLSIFSDVCVEVDG
jgi:hypothetical protein